MNMRTLLLAATLTFTAACGAESPPAAEHADEVGANQIHIEDAAAEASGIALATAGPSALREVLVLPGRIVLQPSARAELHAPYPGPVRAVLKNVGDPVRRGDVLARVESSESLQTYSIVAPIDGVILERDANVGDLTEGHMLFVIGDLARLQVELNVSTRDAGRVTSGQRVLVTGLDGATQIDARIETVLPAVAASSQTLTARAPFRAPATPPIRPGMAVRGAVVLAEQEVAIGVPDDAVQTLGGQSVVFVLVADETYEARPVTTGRRGGGVIEITAGLTAGERYVGANAFLVKAEIGKGEAGHGH
ncbi:MAG TPA: efflux RND transporter periplasmic adaptor subunit [Terricaulis sp.]|nr:efflux RND transporter periplasmic adaptor subunit [Terricaulis sp.]